MISAQMGGIHLNKQEKNSNELINSECFLRV